MSNQGLKRVIFIASANHSGSTLVGCILGANFKNDFQGFHIGEAHAFFNKRHDLFGVYEGFGDVWSKIDPGVGYANAYGEIFGKVKTSTIIDSSKTLRNLQLQAETCRANGWPLHVVVTCRPFVKIWRSGKKNGNAINRIKGNINSYFHIMDFIKESDLPYTIVNIEKIVESPTRITQKLCDAVGLEYFSGKENYWEFEHQHLYGNRTQGRMLKTGELQAFDTKRTKSLPCTRNVFLNEQKVIEMEEFLVENSI